MSLIGNYYCSKINSTLVIQNANNANGKASGYFELDGITIPIVIHYHFKNNVGPETNLWFGGNEDDPNEYVGGAGLTNNKSYKSIDIAGGYPVEGGVKTFQGVYKRVYLGKSPK